ncbi:MAG TPA: hypothetical protein VJS47_07635 [Rhizomicrobium sp.]|nr:hypothetical protein [Rhizomicrobium sp.]
MAATYFAISAIIAVLIIYWGSAEPEPAWLSKLFAPRQPDAKPTAPPNSKVRR